MEGSLANGRRVITVKKSEPILVHPEMETDKGFYFLSNLDQNLSVIIPTLYCFKADEKKSSESAAEVIKQALAKILVHFYPLAGTLTFSSDGKLVVECTNKGVPFVEAVADCELEALGNIAKPDPVKLGKLVHTFPEAKSILEIPLLTAQVTRFRCGGFVFGMTINHCMTDGISAMAFVNSWAETARGIPLNIPPFIDRTIFRSRQPPQIEFKHDEYKDIADVSNMAALYEDEHLLYRSFRFDSDKIERLKNIAMEDGVVKYCTSFTVLTALVWRVRSKALKMKPNQQTKLLFAVDGRSKFRHPFPKGYFGNAILLTCCLCTAGELIEKPLSFAVNMVQEAIKLVTEDYIRSTIDYFEVTRARPSLTATLLATTWARLAFDTTNFGWGEPTQTGCVTLPEKEMALFQPLGKDKKLTDVLLGLPVTSMKAFEEMIMQI